MNGLTCVLGSGGYRGLTASILLALLFLFSGCATTSVWHKWSPEEQKRYFGLTFIEEDSVLAQYRNLPEQEQRESWYKLYWALRDPAGSLLSEHRQRLDKAWAEFGGKMFFRDDRSSILVRFGPPEKESSNKPFLHAISSDRLAGGDYIKERSWMIWEYPSLGRYYDFLLEGNYYELVATTYGDNMYPLAYFSATVQKPDSSGFKASPQTARIMDCSFSRFRADDSLKVKWEIYWQIPVSAKIREEGNGKYIAVYNVHKEGKPFSTDTIIYELKYTGSPVLIAEGYGLRGFDLHPGKYTMEIRVSRAFSDTVYYGFVESELVGYRSGVREVSDAEMAVLQDSTYISDGFRKGKYRRVIPAISRVINRYQPFFVYYEAYSLMTDRLGEHQVNVGHGIYRSDSLGVLKECIVDTRDIYYQDSGNFLRICHKVHPMAMEPGEYILVTDIKDLISGRISKLTVPFKIESTDPDVFKTMKQEKNRYVPNFRPPPRNPLRN
jgi:hypothetical protein